MRQTATALLLATTLLTVSACGGGDDDSDATSDTTVTSTSEVAAESDEPTPNEATPSAEPTDDTEPPAGETDEANEEPADVAEQPSGDDEEPDLVDGGTAAVTPVDEQTLAAAVEEGEVLMYTNADDQQTAPIKEAFERAYPGITLRSLPLGDEEMFQRYETEVASGTRTADVVMNSDALAWSTFIADGHIAPYDDPNAPNLPAYAILADGVYAASLDPVIAVFNKALLPEDEQPTTMVELAAMAADYDGMIGTTDISNAIQFSATTSFIDAYGDAGWDTIDAIAQHASVEASNGPLVQKLAQGQYVISFFVAGSVRPFITGDITEVVNYTYLDDGTPLVPRAFGVTAEAQRPNAARVFVNWLLSVEGQTAGCAAGFTPYREGVECEFGLSDVLADVGEDNLIVGSFGPDLATTAPAIIDRWNEAYGR